MKYIVYLSFISGVSLMIIFHLFLKKREKKEIKKELEILFYIILLFSLAQIGYYIYEIFLINPSNILTKPNPRNVTDSY